MLFSLKHAAEDHLDLPETPSFVALSTPYLPGLYQEDLNDALTLAGLTTPFSIGDIRFEAQLSRSIAALAGNGLGLCENFTSLSACIDEEAEMPSKNILTIHLGPDALDLSVDFYVKAAKQPPLQYRDESPYVSLPLLL